MRIFDATLATLERALDVRLARQTVLSGNLANVDTPGFEPRDIDFASAMAGAAGGDLRAPEAASAPHVALGEIPLTLASHAPPALPGAPSLPGSASPSLAAGPAAAPGIDGNAVDPDRTLVALAENAMQYGAAAKAVGKKLAILRYAASDGTA